MRTVSPCPCQRPNCTCWHVSPEAAVQSVSFTEVQARAVAKLLDEMDSATPAVDYRKVLAKYISMVGDAEGVTYVDHRPGPPPKGFTVEEYAALREVDREVRATEAAAALEATLGQR